MAISKLIRTSVEIPEDLYEAFKRMGGATLSLLVREAMRDYIGIKGVSEDALAVLVLKQDRLTEEKLHFEKKLQHVDGDLNELEIRMQQMKMSIAEKDQINKQAQIMKEEINPVVRAMEYKIKSITPELHNAMLKLKELGVDHNLESLQRHATKLENADWLLGGYRNT